MFHVVIVDIEHRLVWATLHDVIDVIDELREAIDKVVDELVRQRAQTLHDFGRKFSVVVFLVADCAKQVAKAYAVVCAIPLQILTNKRRFYYYYTLY